MAINDPLSESENDISELLEMSTFEVYAILFLTGVFFF